MKKDLPEIDAQTLFSIFRAYFAKLRTKVTEVREHCKEGDLDAVLNLRKENKKYAS